MSDPSFITIDKITKKFGDAVAVDSVDLTIGRGEFFSLLGPSGCGKTTLLRIMGGLEVPTSGRILVDAEDVTSLPAYRRPTNMVFQSYAIFPHLSVGENIGYGLRRREVSRSARGAMIADMLDLIGLAGHGDRKVTTLSGGQLQRVALSRALILKPKVLLLDEPLAALDKKLRERMQVELRRIQREVGITFVFVTHDQEEALTLSDQIAVMSGGHVLQAATPKILYERPASRQVAEFVGDMNFFTGRVVAVDAQSPLVDLGPLGRVRVGTPGRTLKQDQRVTVAFRPERILVTSEPNSGTPCKVVAKSYFGSKTQYSMKVEGIDAPVVVSRANDIAHPVLEDDTDQPLWMRPDELSGVFVGD